jgi:CTP synthase
MLLLQANNVTTGRIYLSVEKERRGDFWENSSSSSSYHQRRMQLLGNSGDFDIVITEIGGTVGGILNLYIESVRQMVWDLGEHMLSLFI